jgi:4-amino-4-deoxy-L-arabinose transferase-like glycosyltransferase
VTRGPLAQEHVTKEHAESVSESGLDRRIDLTSIPLNTIAWFVVIVLATSIHLIGRTHWPLSASESEIARDAWALLQGSDLSSTADAFPAIIQITALFFFLFGDTDYVARLVPLTAGVGILITLFWLRSWFGNLPALSIAIVWTLSPVMAISTLRLDGGTFLVLSSLLTLGLIMRMHREPDSRKALTLGVALAIGLTSHPLGWIVLPLTVLPAMLLIRDFRLGGHVIEVITSFVVTLVLVTSWFGAKIASIPAFFDESFSALWNDHVARIGGEWPLSLIVMLVDEPLPLLLVVVGLFFVFASGDRSLSAHPAVFLSVIAWILSLLTAGVLLAGKGPALYAVSLFPLIVAGGLGLSMVLETVFRKGWQGGRPALWTGVALGLLIAILRLAELLAMGPDGELTGWMVNILALTLLIVVPLGYIAIRLATGTGWSLVPVSVLVLVAILGGLGLRTSLLLPVTGDDRPGEVLLAGSSTPAVGMLQQRLRTYSRDATTYIQDVRDVTGGHGLMIVIQNELADPFAWYFRDFPNLLVVAGPDDIPPGVEPDAIIVTVEQADEWQAAHGEHQARNYAIQYADPENMTRSTYEGLLLAALNPLEFGNIFNFAVHRSNPGLLEREEMVLLLRNDHAEVIWGNLVEPVDD